MKKIKVGINGFGRIGRIAARIILNRPNLTLAAINSRADTSSHAYLLKYDTTYGIFPSAVAAVDNSLVVEKQKITVFNNDTPAEIPWNSQDIDIVIDSTGKFRKKEDLQGHLTGKVKYVVLSAPAKDDTKTLVLGVNERLFDPKNDKIISNSSCTTNCLATTVRVLHDNFKIVRGFMNTIHAVTDSQNLLDNSHKKEVRLRRAAFGNMIPTSTGSAKDIGKLYPDLAGKIICTAVRVPLLAVSMINLTVETKKKATEESINSTFEKASKTSLKGILGYAYDELVSHDLAASPFSAIFDPFLTQVNGDNLINVYAWYDNEWGYTTRLVDMVEYIAKKGKIL